jgi:2,5-diketo-D-gluconate reductase A
VSAVPSITLNDGNTIPQLGFGVFQIEPEDTAEAVSEALEIGYRHIDTAEMYGNEKEVGEAVRTSGLNRSDFVSTWKTLEEFKADGRSRSIGVSNFQIHHLERLASETKTVPAVNQIEVHPYLTNDAVRSYGRDYGIATEAWSPIAQGAVLKDPTITEIAEKVGKTAAQVVLRWHIQRSDIVFPKSVTPSRIKENFEIFDFELGFEDMEAISALDRNEKGRTGAHPDTFAYVPN